MTGSPEAAATTAACRQTVLDHGDIDAAPPGRRPTARGLGEDRRRRRRHGRSLYVHGLRNGSSTFGQTTSVEARIAARAYEVAHAKLDRRRAFRPE